MKRLSIITLLLLPLTQVGWGVSFLHVNNSVSTSITALPSDIVLSCDVASSGNRISCEIFHDLNENGQIDACDPRVYFHYFIDGLGTIYDGDSLKDAIIGDESSEDGIIRGMITFDQKWCPGGRQNWLMRVTDADQSSVTAAIDWRLPQGQTQVFGRIIDKMTGKPVQGMVIHLTDSGAPARHLRAITNAEGEYTIDLKPGEWTAFASHPWENLYKDACSKTLQLTRGRKTRLDFLAEKHRAFISGQVTFDDGKPVGGVSLVLQSTDELQVFHSNTDENGVYCIGVDPGEYTISLNQYFAKFLGNDFWPEGYAAQPENFTVIAPSAGEQKANFTFSPHTASINGVCTLNNRPIADVLIQGVGMDPKSKKQILYQTFSKNDGSYSLGVGELSITSLFAQKQGLYTVEKKLDRLDMKQEKIKNGLDFNFDKQAVLMSLSGRLVDENNKPLPGVYVAAFNEWENGPEGHLITRTDDNGEYLFDIKREGDWRVGVFVAQRHPSPSMYYKYLAAGVRYGNLDFVLTPEKANIAKTTGQLQLADFYVLPHRPDPFFRSATIDFILPKAGYTQVEVLTIEGTELVKLIEDQMSKGYQKIMWDGKDDQGNAIAGGVYLCRVKSDKQTTVQPITLMK